MANAELIGDKGKAQDTGVNPVASGAALVDMSVPQVNSELRSLSAQDQMRDSIKADFDSGRRYSPSGFSTSRESDVTVYLVCNDGGSCVVQEKLAPDISAGQRLASSALMTGVMPSGSDKVFRAAEAVRDVLRSGKNDTVLPNSLTDEMDLADHLGGASQTYNPPMAAKHRGYWDNATRNAEKSLVEKLQKSQGEISLSELSKSALDVCNGDAQFALLTLANFTKNMAAIERRQVRPEQIAPDLRSTYSQGGIDSLFHRIQGLADSKENDYYNKEGAIYHFFGAMLAGSQWGAVAEELVNVDNYSLKVHKDGRTDYVKDQAGLAGVRAGVELGKNYQGAGFVARQGLKLAKYFSVDGEMY